MNTPAKRSRDGNYLWIALPVLLLLVGTWLRAPAVWTTAPFDVDEALYASFSRQISHENNPLLVNLPVDKPPLSFYTGALSFKLFGTPSGWAARLPGLMASIVSLAVFWQLVWTLYRNRLAAFLAASILACSPLDIAYAGTAFTDAQTTMWTLLALLAIAKRRWGIAGLLMGLAFATKQSAILALPLVLLVGIVGHSPNRKQTMRFAALFGTVIVILFAWDMVRGSESPSWWVLGATNNAPGRLVRPNELIPRLRTWLSYLISSAGNAGILAWVGITSLWLAFSRFRRNLNSRRFALDTVWLVYVWAYVTLYALVAFAMYPRYAHILSPLLAILAARPLAALITQTHSRWLKAAIFLGVILLALPCATTSRTNPPWTVHAQQHHAGIEATANYLNSLPPGTIVYDHWTGWLLGWYTGQNHPQDMWLRIVYYPTPETLVQDALAQPDPLPRFFVVPDWAPAAPWLHALDHAGFAPQVVQQNGQFRVYRLTPPD